MEFVAVFAIAVGVAILNSFHVIIQWAANKPGEVFTGITHSFADYFLYTAQMAQGASGRWVYSDQLFTNEAMAPTWYYWFNVTLGHLGSLIGLSPFATYNVSLFLFVVVLCLVWYFLAKTLYPTNRLLRLTTWLMILTATSFFSPAPSGAGLDFSQVEILGQFWFSPSPVFNRLGGVPYQVFQNILFILLAIVFARLLTIIKTPRIMNQESGIRKRTYVIFLIPLAILAGSANPIQMVLFVAAAVAITMYAVTHRKNFNVSIHQSFLSLSIVTATGAFGAWMTNQEFAQQAVFTAARTWELAQRVPNTLPVLLLSIGPILFFVPFGLQRAFKQEDALRILLIVWGLLSFVLFLSPIPRLLQLSPVRFLHPVPYAAALAILGAEGLARLSGSRHGARILLLILYLLLTIPSISRQFIDRITPAKNPQLLMDTIYNHVPVPIVEALTWLKQEQVQSYSTRRVVLADPAVPVEVLVPVFTGKPSFSGHPIHTLYPGVKEARRQEFFGGKMNPDQAKRFIADHRIGYIISSRTLPLFKQVYKNDRIIIYTP